MRNLRSSFKWLAFLGISVAAFVWLGCRGSGNASAGNDDGDGTEDAGGMDSQTAEVGSRDSGSAGDTAAPPIDAGTKDDASGPQVWYTIGSGTDYMNLVSPSSPWDTAQESVRVLKIYPNFASASSDADLTSIIQFASSHGMALAVEWETLTKSPTTCGGGVEGFDVPGASGSMAKRIERLGGTLAYVAMDEPVYYGHYYTGKNSCQWSFTELAQDAAANIQMIRDVFPNVEVGEIEPISSFPTSTPSVDLSQWLDAFRAATGALPAFLHEDQNWAVPLSQTIPAVLSLLNAAKIPFGIIFNGDGSATSDARWMMTAEENIQSYNNAGFQALADVIIQSWDIYPSLNLPETSPTALTYLVDYYFASGAQHAPPVPLERFYDKRINRHFYTPWLSEQENLRAYGWTDEGSIGNVYFDSSGTPGLVPLYSCFIRSNVDYYFTTDYAEVTAGVATGEYIYEGISGYVFPGTSPYGTPIYGATSTEGGHFLTSYAAEYNGLPAEWDRSGVQFSLP